MKTTKRLLSVLLTVAMILSMVPSVVFASETPATTETVYYENNFETTGLGPYAVEDGVLKVTGATTYQALAAYTAGTAFMLEFKVKADQISGTFGIARRHPTNTSNYQYMIKFEPNGTDVNVSFFGAIVQTKALGEWIEMKVVFDAATNTAFAYDADGKLLKASRNIATGYRDTVQLVCTNASTVAEIDYIKMYADSAWTLEGEVNAIKSDRNVAITWADDSNFDGLRPASVVVNAYSGETLVASQAVTAENGWKATMSLPVYADTSLTAASYTFGVVAPEGYTAAVSGSNITLTHKSDVEILYSNDFSETTLGSLTIADGALVVNTIVRQNLSGVFTGSVVFETRVKVDAIGTGDEVGFARRNNANTSKYQRVIGFTAQTETTANLRLFEQYYGEYTLGEWITLKMVFDTVNRVAFFYDGEGNLIATRKNIDTAHRDLIQVISEKSGSLMYVDYIRHYTDTTWSTEDAISAIKVDKEVAVAWDDVSNFDGLRPASVVVNAYSGEALVGTQTVTAENGWKATLSLPKYADASLTEATYTFQVVAPEGYTAAANGANITLTHTPDVDVIYYDDFTETTLGSLPIADGALVVNSTTTQNIGGKFFEGTMFFEVKMKVDALGDKGAFGFGRRNLTNTSNYQLVIGIEQYEGRPYLSFFGEFYEYYTYGEWIELKVVFDSTNNVAFIYDGEGNLLATRTGMDTNHRNLMQVVSTRTGGAMYVDYIKQYADSTWSLEGTVDAIKVDKDITIAWNDSDDIDGIRPDALVVNAYNGETLVASQTVTAENGWKATVTLPKYADVQLTLATYTFEVAAPKDYTAEVNGTNITLSHTPYITTIYYNDFTESADGFDKLTTVENGALVLNNSVIQNIAGFFTDPIFFEVKVKVDAVADKDEVGFGLRKLSNTGLYLNAIGFVKHDKAADKAYLRFFDKYYGEYTLGEWIELKVIFDSANNVAFIFDGDGNLMTVCTDISEDHRDLMAVVSFRSGSQMHVDYINYYTDSRWTLSEELAKVKTSIPVNIVWNDNNDSDTIRPESVTVSILNGEEVVISQAVTAENGWAADIEVPMYDEVGNAIAYTVAVDAVDQYDCAVAGGTVTLTHVPRFIYYYMDGANVLDPSILNKDTLIYENGVLSNTGVVSQNIYAGNSYLGITKGSTLFISMDLMMTELNTTTPSFPNFTFWYNHADGRQEIISISNNKTGDGAELHFFEKPVMAVAENELLEDLLVKLDFASGAALLYMGDEIIASAAGFAAPNQYIVRMTMNPDEGNLSYFNVGDLVVYSDNDFALETVDITWNIEDEIIVHANVKGQPAVFPYGDPVKEEDEAYTYTFIGWDADGDGEVDELTSGCFEYTAVFAKEAKSYTITWIVDGVESTESYAYGDVPAFKGNTDKAMNGNVGYVFLGWDVNPAAVTGDATYTAIYEEVTYVAKVGETYFTSLEAALEAGDEIVMLTKLVVAAGETKTWDLTGKTLVIADVDGNYGLVVKGDLTINGGTFVVNGLYGIGVTGTLTVNGGTFNVAGDNDYLIGNWGTTVINGGSFNGQYNCVNNFAGTTEINDGSFTTAEFDWSGEYESEDVTADAGLTVNGGTFSKPVDEAYCAEGFMPVENADGTYGVGIASFTVTWVVAGGTFTETYAPNDLPEFKGSLVKESDATSYYTFTGWDKTIEKVTGDVTYTATYKTNALVAFAAAQVVMGNNLDMMFAIRKASFSNWDGMYIEMVHKYADGTPDDVQIVTPDKFGVDGIMYFVTYEGLAAKMMSDDIIVTVYNADGQPVSKAWVDSMRAYAMRRFDQVSGTIDKTLFVDMLNYGAEAQKSLNYNVDDLANALFEQKHLDLVTEGNAYNTGLNRGNKHVGSNLILESNISFWIAFKGMNTNMYATVDFVNHLGDEVHMDVAGSQFGNNNGMYYIDVNTLVIADARREITVKVYNADGSLYTECHESIEDYLARKGSAGVSELYAATMKFSDSAYAFLHK